MGALVAVRDRQADALARLVQHHYVHAPGVDADALRHDPALQQLLQSVTDRLLQRVDIPAVIPFRLMTPVGETANLLQRQ
ncbi:MAG TPA: hypothetical protein DGH25_10490 [Erwiniaceae bacterium]|nr:hypothetical protein [Erwiniaceae bacterium]